MMKEGFFAHSLKTKFVISIITATLFLGAVGKNAFATVSL